MKATLKKWTCSLALLVGVGVALCSAHESAALVLDQGQPSDPVSVLTAYLRAVGTDVNAALAMFTDDATLRISPPPPGTTGLWTGKEEIRQGLEYSIQHNVKGEIVGAPKIEGNKVTFASKVTNSFFQEWGVAPVAFTTEAVIEGGKIKSFTNTMDASEQARVSAAAQAHQPHPSAQAPAGMPRTGGETVGELARWIVSGLALAALCLIIAGATIRHAGWLTRRHNREQEQ
jgi:hypothetical protein